MRLKAHFFRKLITSYCSILVTSMLFCQSNDAYILDSAAVKVYSNPDEAVKIAEYVYNRNNNYPKLQATALLLLSNIASKKMQYDQSLNFALKAKELSFKTRDLKLKLKVLNTIAMHYYISGVYNNALQILDEAEKISAEYPHKDSIRIILGNNWGIRGAIYKEQLSPSIALKYFIRAIGEFKKEAENPKALINLSLIYYNMGYCNISLERNSEAKSDFNSALYYADKIGAPNLIAYAKQGIAEVYTHEGKYSNAIKELQSAISISKKTEPDPELDCFIYKSLSDNYLATNDWKNYQVYSKKYFTAQEDNIIAKRKFIQESLEKTNTAIQQEMNEHRLYFYFALTTILVLICILIFTIIKDQIIFKAKLNDLRAKLT